MRKKLDTRHVLGIILILFILKGIIEFIWKGNHSFPLEEVDLRIMIVVNFMVMFEMLTFGKEWKSFRFLFVMFLSDYLLKKVFDFFSIEKLTFTIIPYLIILGVLLLVFFVRLNIKSKEDFPTYSKTKADK